MRLRRGSGILLGGLICCLAGANCQRSVLAQESVDAESWQLSPQATLSLGSAEGPAADLWMDVVGSVRTGSGLVGVLDRGTGELSFFDSSGHHVRTVGGQGAGPGEFRSPESLLRCGGDSLFVVDRSLGRISVFAPDGEYIRQISSLGPQDGWIPVDFTCNSGGSFATTLRNLQSLLSQQGSVRVETRVEVSSGVGAPIVLGPFPGDEVLSIRGNFMSPPFSVTTSVLLGQDRLYVGTSDAPDLAVYSLDGRKIGTIAHGIPRKTLTGARIRGKAQSMSEDSPDPDASYRFWSGLEYPEQLPAFDHALLDSAGNLWIREYPPTEADTANWRIFDPGGSLVATLAMPTGFTVYQATPSAVLVKHSDQYGVEHVEIYEVRR